MDLTKYYFDIYFDLNIQTVFLLNDKRFYNKSDCIRNFILERIGTTTLSQNIESLIQSFSKEEKFNKIRKYFALYDLLFYFEEIIEKNSSKLLLSSEKEIEAKKIINKISNLKKNIKLDSDFIHKLKIFLINYFFSKICNQNDSEINSINVLVEINENENNNDINLEDEISNFIDEIGF